MSKDEFNHKYLAKEWFENLRNEICDSLEECERIVVGGNDDRFYIRLDNGFRFCSRNLHLN